MKKYIFLFLATALFFWACSEDERPQIATDAVPPQPVSDVVVTNIPGGAILKYKLPEDEDLLYVKAQYTLKDGLQSEVRASLYSDTLKIAGFGSQDEREITLFSVDRSENVSAPVKVKIQPLEPPVITIGKTLKLMEDFGGVHAFWTNLERAEVSVVIEKEDNNQEYVPIDAFYSTVVDGDGASRGMDTIPANFKTYVRDRWGNMSEPIQATITPLFETKFDRLKFTPMSVDGDEPSAWGWVLQNLFDGNLNSGFHTAQGSGRWPQWVTLDMGVTGRISRIKIWQRDDNGTWLYQHGNIRKFEIWGTNSSTNLQDWNSWTKMMECESVKPSGLPLGQYSGEDASWARAGEEFICSPDMPAVRYLRLKVLETWSGGDFFHIMELEVYGDNR